jgi:hypothetical protein
MGTASKATSQVFRLTIKPAGPRRSEKQLKTDVAAALREALEKTREKPAYKAVRAKAEPEGAFVGVAVAAVWVLKTFGGGVLAGAGTAAGKKLVDYFAKALRSRKLDPGPAKPVKSADKKKNNGSGKKGKKKS